MRTCTNGQMHYLGLCGLLGSSSGGRAPTRSLGSGTGTKGEQGSGALCAPQVGAAATSCSAELRLQDRQTPAFGRARPELHQLACAQPGAMEICIQAQKKNPGRNGWQQAQWALSPEVGAEPQGGCCWLTLPLGRRRLLHSPGCCPPSSPTGPSTPVCHQHRAGGCRALLATVRTRSEQKEHCATEHFSISRWKHLIRCKSPV